MYLLLPSSIQDADYIQVRRFVIGQPVSERALLARTNHSIRILHSSCPSAADVCRRFAHAHLSAFPISLHRRIYCGTSCCQFGTRFGLRICLQAFAVACTILFTHPLSTLCGSYLLPFNTVLNVECFTQCIAHLYFCAIAQTSSLVPLHKFGLCVNTQMGIAPPTLLCRVPLSGSVFAPFAFTVFGELRRRRP